MFLPTAKLIVTRNILSRLKGVWNACNVCVADHWGCDNVFGDSDTVSTLVHGPITEHNSDDGFARSHVFKWRHSHYAPINLDLNYTKPISSTPSIIVLLSLFKCLNKFIILLHVSSWVYVILLFDFIQRPNIFTSGIFRKFLLLPPSCDY